MHVWNEFSEFLPENRVPTSADFNTYPIRIFFFQYIWPVFGRSVHTTGSVYPFDPHYTISIQLGPLCGEYKR